MQHRVRSVLLSAPGCSLLVPVSVFAELLSYETPRPLAGAPDWLVGSVGWRGVELPVVSMGSGDTGACSGARFAVLWALNDERADRAYALLVSGVPRVHVATADTVRPAPGEREAFVASHADVNGERVAIPNLSAIEKALSDMAWGQQATQCEAG